MGRPATEIKQERGQRLKILCKEQGITQAKLAETICISQQTISKIIQGKASLTEQNARIIVSKFPSYCFEWLMCYNDYKTVGERIEYISGRRYNRRELIERLVELHGYNASIEQMEGICCHLQYPPGLSDEKILERAHGTEPEEIVRISPPSGGMKYKLIERSEYEKILKEIDDFIEMKLSFQFRTPVDGTKEYWG